MGKLSMTVFEPVVNEFSRRGMFPHTTFVEGLNDGPKVQEVQEEQEVSDPVINEISEKIKELMKKMPQESILKYLNNTDDYTNLHISLISKGKEEEIRKMFKNLFGHNFDDDKITNEKYLEVSTEIKKKKYGHCK